MSLLPLRKEDLKRSMKFTEEKKKTSSYEEGLTSFCVTFGKSELMET